MYVIADFAVNCDTLNVTIFTQRAGLTHNTVMYVN